ncbi:MAG TPA: hypothetical protein VN618_15860 [Solirubrobacteraceae bacterium]|nr:hypothetical protein [Solirubrobacteraceae bacterium]
MALEDQRADRVAGRGAEHGEHPRQLAGAVRDIDPDERHDAREADQQTGHPLRRRTLRALEAQREQRDHQRHRGDQDRGQRRGDALLAEGDQGEGERDLDDPVGGDPAQLAAQPGERAGTRGEGEQHHGRECDARERDPGRRRAAVDGDLDEQVGDAPDARHRRERDPAPSAHRPSNNRRRPSIGARP